MFIPVIANRDVTALLDPVRMLRWFFYHRAKTANSSVDFELTITPGDGFLGIRSVSRASANSRIFRCLVRFHDCPECFGFWRRRLWIEVGYVELGEVRCDAIITSAIIPVP